MLDIIGGQKKLSRHQEDAILDSMIGKSFWCIKPNILKETKRIFGPMIPYQSNLRKGPGLWSWNLMPENGLTTMINNIDELFQDRESAVEAYIEAQIAYIKKLEEELKREEVVLLDLH